MVVLTEWDEFTEVNFKKVYSLMHKPATYLTEEIYLTSMNLDQSVSPQLGSARDNLR